MADGYRKGRVYVQNIYAGLLEETEEGYSFTYDPKYLKMENPLSVSITLPLQEAAYHSAILFPFFDGLIPEGWLLEVVSKNWKINKEDRFGLLLLACKDCIGDVCVKSEEHE